MTPALIPVSGPEPRWRFDLGEATRAIDADADGIIVGTAAGVVWRLDTAGEVVDRLELGSPILAIARTNSPPRLVATTEDRRLVVFGGRPWAIEHELPLARWGEVLVALPGGEVALGVGREVLRVDLDGPPRVTRLGELASTPTGLAVSSVHELLAASAYGGVATWHLRTGVRRDLACKGSMLGVSWSPDGRVVVCPTQERSLHFWRMPLGQDAAMSGYAAKPVALAWNKKGTLLATGGAFEVSIWRFSAMSPEGTSPLLLPGHEEEVMALAFHPERDLVASGCRSGQVLVHDAQRRRPPWPPRVAQPEPVAAVRFLSARQLVALSQRGLLSCWSIES